MTQTGRHRLREDARAFNEALGRRISGARQASGMKCKDLAMAAGISPARLYWYEVGRCTCPPIILQRLALALKMPVGALMPKFALSEVHAK